MSAVHPGVTDSRRASTPRDVQQAPAAPVRGLHEPDQHHEREQPEQNRRSHGPRDYPIFRRLASAFSTDLA